MAIDCCQSTAFRFYDQEDADAHSGSPRPPQLGPDMRVRISFCRRTPDWFCGAQRPIWSGLDRLSGHDFDQLSAESRQVFRRTARDHVAVDDDLLVDPMPARIRDIVLYTSEKPVGRRLF